MTCNLECAVIVTLIIISSVYITLVVNRTFNAKD